MLSTIGGQAVPAAHLSPGGFSMSGYIFGVFYDITRRVPAGKVATYGQIARLAGMPRCARTVG